MGIKKVKAVLWGMALIIMMTAVPLHIHAGIRQAHMEGQTAASHDRAAAMETVTISERKLPVLGAPSGETEPSEETETKTEAAGGVEALPDSLKKLSAIDPMKYADPFGGLTGIAKTEAEDIMTSYYRLLSVFASAGLVFSFIWTGIRLMLQGVFTRSCSKEEIITAIGAKVIAFAMFCSAVLLIGVVGDMVNVFKK